ncbi:hypothetical protein RN001_012575 [Aquatica leii]|uniref:TATA box-binding protein-associated factor RNA polymerase I subunit B n=1 Tax=Aquatica leii TaxID=1421715 RepID=A0AAN7QFB5_9COLE|nr:hypothetical protein RN001_012575 [Aquatica leii]
MADNITCNVCGGTSFHKESGFYYCNECQTQSQDIQERVFAIDEDATEPTARTKSSKKLRTAKKVDDRLTSWECYNYVLRGLVDELIQLGADVSLKKTVHVLWFRYLHKLEVTNSPNEFPKLSAINSKTDAEIIYGRSAKRKRGRSKRTPSPSSSSEAVTDSSVSRRERSKKRRSLVLAEYDDFNATLQSTETSLLNQSLGSLKSDETSPKDKDKYLQYNKYARKELLKHLTKNHLKTHIKDVNSTRTCHKLTAKSLSTSYVEGPTILSRMKIYAFLYLGLLINKDNIQLGDLIRFVREGRLSYHYIDHFFPEDLHEKLTGIKSWNDKQAFLSHYRMRRTTAQLAQLLDVTTYVPIPNLLYLCRRYCHELNLPDEVWGYCLNLIAKVTPNMKLTAKSTRMPNYEGRVLSFIMFVLKMMFSLDGETEHHMSQFAQKINDNTANETMFVWNDWMYYIHYRKLILTQHHFPTNYSDNPLPVNPELSTIFLNNDYMKNETEVKLNRESDVIKTLLEKFRDTHCQLPQELTLSSTLTPFRTYSETLRTSHVVQDHRYLTDVLEQNFCKHSLKFLTSPFVYLDELYSDCKILLKHRGANNRINIIKFKNLQTERALWRKHAKKEIFVNTSVKTVSVDDKEVKKRCNNLEDTVTKRNTRGILKNFNALNKSSFIKHKKYLIEAFKQKTNVISNATSSFNSSRLSTQERIDKTLLTVHYNPYERYWLKSLNVNSVSNKEFLKFLHTFPKPFRDLLTECARITEQDTKELFDEFNDVEVYLCYVAKVCDSDKRRHKVANRELLCLINKATKAW